MGNLFGFGKDQPSDTPRNPDMFLTFRLLAAGYLLYMAWDTLQMYLKGGEDAPSLTLLIVCLVILGGGGIWIGVVSFLQWKKQKKAAQEAAEEVTEEETAEEEAAEEASLPASEEDRPNE